MCDSFPFIFRREIGGISLIDAALAPQDITFFYEALKIVVERNFLNVPKVSVDGRNSKGLRVSIKEAAQLNFGSGFFRHGTLFVSGSMMAPGSAILAFILKPFQGKPCAAD
jgi:hypothetical protein